MPTLEQLPEAVLTAPTDVVLIDQAGTAKSATVAVLTAGLQPALMLAPGTLLGRSGIGAGAPQPINLGTGLTLSNATIGVDTTAIAPVSSPQFVGSPTAPTAVLGDNSSSIATTAFVQANNTRAIRLAGDVIVSGESANGVINTALATITTPGTYSQVTVNAKGQVTSGSSLSVPGTDVSASVVQALGATQASPLSTHLGIQLDAVLDFGADPTGSADSTLAIQTAIVALQTAGGGKLRLAGQFKISSTLTITGSHINLSGLGHGQLHGDLTWPAPSRIVWAGSSGGTMLNISPVTDTISGKALISVEVHDILFDCQSLAATGVKIASVRHGKFKIAYLNPSVGTSNQAGIVLDTADIAEYNDTQYNELHVVGAELGSGGQGILLQAKSRACKAAGAIYYGNTSYNNFKYVDLHYWRGVPITLRETDNNVFENWGANAPPMVPPAHATPPYATANSIEIQGSSDPVWAFAAISNVFVHGAVAGPIMCRGTPSYNVASGAGTPPNPNLFLQLDKGNGVADPTIEAGAYASFGDLYFIDNGKGLTQATLSDTRAGVQSLRAKLASLGNIGGAAFHASNGMAAQFFSPDVSQSWAVNSGVDGSLSLIPAAQSYFPLSVGQPGQPEVRLSGAGAGSPVAVSAYSSASANVSMVIAAQGTGTVYSSTGHGIQFQVTDSGAPAANIVSARGAPAGSAPAIQVYGTDTNIDLNLAGQGTGLVRGTTAPTSDNSSAFATTAWVQGQTYVSGHTNAFSIGNGVLGNAAQPANAAVDLIAPLAGTTYVDNVLSVQNNSVNASGLAGNAAIRFRASTATGGYERGAIGYSAPINSAFFPHLLYAEIGNIAVAADANDTDFSVVNTHASGALHFPGTSYQALTVQGSTGNIAFAGPTGTSAGWNAATGIFTTTGVASANAGTAFTVGTPLGAALKVNDVGQTALSSLVITPGNGGTPVIMAVSGETNQGFSFRSAGNGQINFQSGAGGGTSSLTVFPNTSAVNAVAIMGGSSGSPVTIGVNGADPNVSININPQGSGTVYIAKLQGAGGTIDNTAVGSNVPSIGSFTTLRSNGLASFSGGLADSSVLNQTPSSGFSISVPNGVSTLQLTPAAPLASGAITCPSSPGNGQWFFVTSTAPVSACSFSAAAGQTILGAPNSLSAFVEVAFQYQTATSRWICQSGNDARVSSVASAAALLFGTGIDGAATISSGTTVLTRDMHYTNLTISGTGVLNPSGWRVFVSGLLDLSAAASGAIIANGTNANNGVAAVGGASPSGLALRTVGQSPSTGGTGGNGTTTTGGAGTSGASVTYGNGGNGGTAGAGGSSSSAGGSAGTGGIETAQIPLNTPTLNFWCSANNAGLASGLLGGGGGAGGGDGVNTGGGGGSGGSYGGVIALFARSISRGTNINTALLQAKGSSGGNGASATAGNAAGGGGGGGGGGGLIYIITENLTGSSIANALDVSGGSGGSGGSGLGTGKGGSGGSGGASGCVQILNLVSPAFASSTWNIAGSTGASTASITGGSGGAGAQLRAGL